MTGTWKGKHLPEEMKKKIAATVSLKTRGTLNPMFGKKHSLETREKMKGRVVSEESKELMRISALSRKPVSKETGAKISARLKGRTISVEHKAKISAANRGHRHTEEYKEISRQRMLLKKPIYFDTGIELTIESWLKTLRVSYTKQHSMHGVCNVDFYLQNLNTVIEADGCYWHGCPIHHPSRAQTKRKRDITNTTLLERKGIRVIRLWEHDIKKMTSSDLLALL